MHFLYQSFKLKLIMFLNFSFLSVPDFSLRMKLFFINDSLLKTSLEACFYDAVLIFQKIVWIKWEKIKEKTIDYYIPRL